MTFAEILTLITAGTTAVVTIINALKAQTTRAQVRETHTQVAEMGKALNGRLAELLEHTRDAGFRAGFLAGQEHASDPEPPDMC